MRGARALSAPTWITMRQLVGDALPLPGGDRCTSQVSRQPPPPVADTCARSAPLKSSQVSAVADGSCRAVLGREHRRGGFGAAQARLKQHEHDRAVERGNLWRVIPAWAGNTPAAPMFRHCSVGHPRVGGEHDCQRFCRHRVRGSSPRGRGTRPQCRENDGQRRVIPRVGGKHEELLARTIHERAVWSRRPLDSQGIF